MKILKKNLFYFCMLVCISVSGILFTGCSSDIEDGDSVKNNKEQKVREEIIECAEDYDVEIKLNEGIVYSELTSDQLDSLKYQIKDFAKIKGSYQLKNYIDNGKYNAKLYNVYSKHELTRSSVIESASAKKSFGNSVFFECTFNVVWSIQNGNITNVSYNGSISSLQDIGNSSTSINETNSGNHVNLSGHIYYYSTLFTAGVFVNCDIVDTTCNITLI